MVWLGGDAPFYVWPGVDVAWTGPVGFYAKAVGAVVSRTFVRMRSRISR